MPLSSQRVNSCSQTVSELICDSRHASTHRAPLSCMYLPMDLLGSCRSLFGQPAELLVNSTTSLVLFFSLKYRNFKVLPKVEMSVIFSWYGKNYVENRYNPWKTDEILRWNNRKKTLYLRRLSEIGLIKLWRVVKVRLISGDKSLILTHPSSTKTFQGVSVCSHC